MKILYLLRHAKSSWKNPDTPDFKRPLNRRGKRDIAVMAQIIRSKNVLIDLVLSSPAKRAKKTTKKVLKILEYKKEKIVFNQDIYNANVSDIFNILQNISPQIQHLMLVGHNPTLTDVANLLLANAKIVNLPTCGLIGIRFPCSSWANIDECSGELLLYEYPKKYKSTEKHTSLEKSV